jgi:hypothetical protein
MDIEVDPFAREHSLKQRSQLFGGGRSVNALQYRPSIIHGSSHPLTALNAFGQDTRGRLFPPPVGSDGIVGFSVSASSSSEAGRRP